MKSLLTSLITCFATLSCLALAGSLFAGDLGSVANLKKYICTYDFSKLTQAQQDYFDNNLAVPHVSTAYGTSPSSAAVVVLNRTAGAFPADFAVGQKLDLNCAEAN